jgi:hypothetical protein
MLLARDSGQGSPCLDLARLNFEVFLFPLFYILHKCDKLRNIFFFDGFPSYLRWKSQRRKIYGHVSGFSKDFSNLGLANGFLFQNLRFLFAIRKHLTKVLDFWLVDLAGLYFIRIFVYFESISSMFSLKRKIEDQENTINNSLTNNNVK